MAKTFKVWVSALDDVTTPICLDVHGQVVEQHEPFVTMVGGLDGPPAHYNCRSSVDIRTMTVRDEVSNRHESRGGARYQRTERRLASAIIGLRRSELGQTRFARKVQQAARTTLPPSVVALDGPVSGGPFRLAERVLS